MKRLALSLLLFCAVCNAFAKTFQWRIAGNETQVSQFAAYHGETVEFELSFTGAASNCTAAAARIYYQTNGMGQAWWQTDGLVFDPTNDVGAATYRFFVRAQDNLGVNYTANGILRMLDSPGFTPSAVELPVKTLDFASIAVHNAPYYTKPETDERIVALAPAPGNYVSVSNAAMNAASAYKSLLDCEWLYDGSHVLARTTPEPNAVAEWTHNHSPRWGGETLQYLGCGIWLFRLSSSGIECLATNAEDSVVLDFSSEQLGDFTLARINDVRSPVVYRDDLASAATDATNYTDEAIASIDIPEPDLTGYAKTNDIQQVRMIVETWESFLDGSNVVFSITNYISGAYNLDAAKLKILELRDGEYREVYNSRDEIVMHIDNFRTNDFRAATNQVIGAVNAAIAGKADKDWGKYTSSGGEAPPNTVYMTAPNTVFAGGLEYERVAVGEGVVCVLTTKGAPVWTQGDEGMFKFHDDGGTNYFGFAKTDSYTIGCNTDGISVQGSLLTLTYDITMSGHPCVWYKASLLDAVWEQLNLPDGSAAPGASYAVSWETTPPPGKQYCYINIGSAPAGFFRATVEVAGEAKFLTNMPADLSGGLLCTNSATGAMGVIKPNYNGSTVTWTWSAR